MNNRGQLGIIVSVLVLIVVIALMIFTFYYVWNNTSSPDNTTINNKTTVNNVDNSVPVVNNVPQQASLNVTQEGIYVTQPNNTVLLVNISG